MSSGRSADNRAHRRWLDTITRRHRLTLTHNNSRAKCSCGLMDVGAPDDMGIVRQRDYLLDAFNDHQKNMRRALREERAKKRAERGRREPPPLQLGAES